MGVYMRELTDGIADTLDIIFSGVLVGGCKIEDIELKNKKREAFRQNLPYFLDKFVYNAFQQEYAVFWELLNRIKGGLFTASQIETILDNNTDIILKSRFVDLNEYIRLDGSILTEEEKFIAFKQRVLKKFYIYSSRYVDETEFKTAVNVYIDWYADTLALEATQNMTLIMGSDDGLKVTESGRRRTYKGTEDLSKYFTKKEAEWRSLKENKGKRDVLCDGERMRERLESLDKPDEEGILDTGLEVIDNVITKIRRGHMLNVVGQTKGGKTRFVNYMVARALEQGLNVAVWMLEGSIKEWEDCQLSNIVFKEYAANAFKAGKHTETNDSGIIVIPTDRMHNNKFNNELEREAAVEAIAKLYTDYNRGRLSFIDSTCYIEDFLDVLDSHYENCNRYDVIVMDSPLLIQSKTGIPERERIASAFIQLKTYIKSKSRAPIAITTAQLKQEVIDELRRNKNKEMDVTAAGGSAEAIRTPDEVIGIFSSKEGRANGQVTLESIASRHHDNFEKFICRCDLGSCYFAYVPELVEAI